jgi:hypothetical protein
MKIPISLILLLLLYGCGSSGPCVFFFSDITVGPNQAGWTGDFWDCVDNDGNNFNFTIFEDGTGEFDFSEPFTWEETGCAEANIQASSRSGTVSDLNGSVAQRTLTGNLKLSIIPIGSFSCVLNSQSP